MSITERTDPSKVNFNFDAPTSARVLNIKLASKTTEYANQVNELVFPLAAANLRKSGSFPQVRVREGTELVFKELLPIPGHSYLKDSIKIDFYLRPGGVLVKMPSFTVPGSTDEFPELDKALIATPWEVTRLAEVVVSTVNQRIAKARRDRRAEQIGQHIVNDNPGFRRP